ncbi:MAG: HDOD domain-containing protein [Nitrospirae bacterium]|nr:HDOD domain-containing protein [Nitrospirota bacterium]
MTIIQKKILSYIEKIPALSPTIARIIAITGNDNASARDLVNAIKLDPVLTAKVLNLINSAYFAMPQQVVSINRAIILLGMNTIKNLALSAEVLSSFNPGEGASFNVNKFWEHSLACAVGCKLIALHVISDPIKQEEFFIAGLIHDIGKIFLIKHFPRDYFSLIKKITDYDQLVVKEKRFFTLNHAEIGGLIADKWALSGELVKSIQHHHDNTVQDESKMPAAVYLSNRYCKINAYDDSIGLPQPTDLKETDWQRLGLNTSMEKELFSTLKIRVEEAKIFLQVRHPINDQQPPQDN